MEVLRSLTVILAVVGKEVVETLRRPAAVASLVLGPLVLMLLFGLGYDGVRKPLQAVVVVPPGSGLPTDPAAYQPRETGGLEIIAVDADPAAGRQGLRDGTVDVVVIAPDDGVARLEAGEQAEIGVEYATIDPLRAAEIEMLARQISAEANRRLIEQAATEGTARAATLGVPSVRPELVAQPTTVSTLNRSPTQPGLVAFFGVAALALVVQHVCVTLLALSLVRERTAGRLEVFRVAPLSAAELMAGKLVAYGAAGALVAALMLLVQVQVLGIPSLGSGETIAMTLGLVIAASLGIGALIGSISDTDRQVVQLSLLVLLASVFFGGFVLSVDEFQPLVQALAHLLPVTHGIALLHDQMLRGATGAQWQLAALAVMAVAWTGLAWRFLRRAMRGA